MHDDTEIQKLIYTIILSIAFGVWLGELSITSNPREVIVTEPYNLK